MVRVDVRRLTVEYDGQPALRDVDLSIADGEAVTVAGPSGSGKTTLLRAIAGLASITTGDVLFDDRSVRSLPTRDRDVALMRSEEALYRHMDVRRNVDFPLRVQRVPEHERSRRATSTARVLRLQELLGRLPSQLSGGERQRVALGRATARTPKVFLLDEPLAQLEPSERERLARDLRTQQQGLGVTSLYVTHEQRELMTMGDRLAVLVDGRLEQVGPPLDVYRAPATMGVAQFVGDPPMAMLRGELQPASWSVRIAGRSLPLPAAARPHLDPPPRTVVIGLRADAVTPTAGRRPAWMLHITNVAPLGHATLATGDLDGRPASRVVARLPTPSARAGEQVEVSIDRDRLHLFDGASGLTRWPVPLTC